MSGFDWQASRWTRISAAGSGCLVRTVAGHLFRVSSFRWPFSSAVEEQEGRGLCEFESKGAAGEWLLMVFGKLHMSASTVYQTGRISSRGCVSVLDMRPKLLTGAALKTDAIFPHTVAKPLCVWSAVSVTKPAALPQVWVASKYSILEPP